MRESSNPSVRPFLDDLRSHCLSLGSDVVEVAHTRNVTYKKESATDHFINFTISDDSIFVTHPEGNAHRVMYNLRCGEDYACSSEPDISINQLKKFISNRYIVNSQS